MIKVSVMYPYTEGARFDHDYYRDSHMPMMKSILGPVCTYYTIDKGISARAPDEPPPYVAMCSFLCTSHAEYVAATAPHRAEISADLPKYTDITPVVQVSEVVVERSDA